MEPGGIFGGTVSILEDVLDLRSVKHNLIVSNITNMDTPNYKAFDVVIDEELDRVGGAKKNVELEKSQQGHLSSTSVGPVGYRVEPVPQSTLKGDGNSVDIERTMASLTENSLLYNALAQILSKKFQGLLNVIDGGKS